MILAGLLFILTSVPPRDRKEIIMKQLKEALFKEAYRCENLAYEARNEYEDCFDNLTNGKLNEKKENLICCEAAFYTLSNFISKNGLSDEYYEFKIRNS